MTDRYDRSNIGTMKMLTLPIKNDTGTVIRWHVPLDDERALHVLKQQDGGLIVIDGGATRVVAASDVEWFMGLLRNCLSYEEVADYANWK